ncbi:MAG: heavy metal-binding domain-containing protein [Armatimonadota bacterium]
MRSHTRLGLLALVVVLLTVALTSGLMAGCNKTATTGPSASAPAAAGTVYACPMHPEVTSSKPGECPKCHMSLVKKG